MAQVTELVTKFSFAGNLSPLNQFNGFLGKAVKGLGLYSVAVKAALGGVMAFTGSVLKSADAQVQLSNNTGVSIERIQELGYAAAMSGSSAGALEQSIAGLNSSIGKATRNGSAEFSRLGLSIRNSNGEIKNADEVLSEVGEKFRSLNISMSEQQTIAGSLGIDVSLVQMLNKTSGEMAAMTSKARAFGLITSEQKKHISAFNTSVTTLKFGFQSIWRQLSVALAPIMTDIVNKFTAFLMANKELIKEGLEKLAKVLFFVSEAVDRFIELIFGVTDAIGGWKNALVLLSVAFIMTPIGRFIAMMTAIILIIDDLIVAFQGGESVIRKFFIDAFDFDIVPMLQSLVKWFKSIPSSVAPCIAIGVLLGKTLISVSAGASKMIPVIKGLTSVIGLLGKAFIKLGVAMITTPIGWIIAGIAALAVAAYLIYKNWEPIKEFFKNLWSSITDKFNEFKDYLIGFIDNSPFIQKFIDGFLKIKDKVCEYLGGLKDIVVGVFTLDTDKILSGFKKTFEALKDIALEVIDLWLSAWSKAADILKGIFSKVFDVVTSLVMEPVETIKGLWSKVTSVFGGEDENKADNPKPDSMKAPTLLYKDPSQGFTNGSSTVQNNRTVQQNIDMRINSTDPIVAGQTAADGINRHLDDAENMNLVINR